MKLRIVEVDQGNRKFLTLCDEKGERVPSQQDLVIRQQLDAPAQVILTLMIDGDRVSFDIPKANG